MVASVAGLATVLLGEASIVGLGRLSPTADSELRYYAAWYVVAGALALWSVRQIESRTAVVRLLFGGLFLGGCGRLLSLATVGRPHPLSLYLMVVELALPLLVVPWQAVLAGRAGRGSAVRTR